jgi:hypothetical protein
MPKIAATSVSTGTRFVFPLSEPPLIIQPADLTAVSRAPRRAVPRTRLPPSLAGSGLIPRQPGAAVKDLASDLPAHLRISCLLQEISNVVITPPGIGFPSENIVFRIKFASPVTTSSQSGYVVDVPTPGASLTYPGTELVFDGIVAGGCGNTAVVPLSVEAAITGLENEITVFSPFEATDATTLKPNGFWTFNFVIRASTINGEGVSDFRVQGLISVFCSNQAAV